MLSVDASGAEQLGNLKATKIKKILIRSTNWLGDAVMTTPALGVVRACFPDATITLLAIPVVAQLFQHHEWIDDVIVYDRAGTHMGISGRLRLAADIRRLNFDAAIILPNSLDSALVPWLSGIPVRLGKGGNGRGFLLTGAYRPKDHGPVHESRHYVNLLKGFGIACPAPDPRLFVTELEKEQTRDFLAAHGINRSDFVVGINPGATYGSAKRWYPDRFAQVARELATTWHAKVVIFGGQGETALAADIEQGLGGTPCINVAGKTSVRELLGLISRCNFFVTNDSGPMHIAAAFRVPLVSIFGSTDHVTTFPFSDVAIVVREPVECSPCKLRECPTDHRCMTAVTAEAVIEAAKVLMAAVSTKIESV